MRSYLAFAALLLLCGCHAHRPSRNDIVVDIESSPNNLDIRMGTDAQSEHIGSLIFEPIVRKDAHYNLQPWLAESFEWTNPTTLVLHVRKGVRFHDGSALTANDVAWSIESMHNDAILTSKAGAFDSVLRAEATDVNTCIVHLKKPDAGLLFNMSDGLFGVVKNGAGKNAPLIGTGPFKFVSQMADKDVVLQRNDLYWSAKPHVETVHLNVVPDAITRALELQKGSADIASNALTLDTVYAMRNDPRVVIESAPGSILNYLNFNTQDPVLRDPRVRQAIAYSIDRKAIIDALFRGEARPADTMLPPGHWAADADVQRFDFDAARSKILLDQAGYKANANGTRLHLTLKTSTDDTTRLLAAILQQQLRAVGIDLELRANEFGTFYSDVTKGAFQIYALRWIGANEDPDIYRYAYSTQFFPPKGANRGHFSNAEVDKLIAEGQAETDQAKRRATYVELQKTLAEQEPSVNLWFLNNVVVHSRRLRNVRPTPSATYDFLVTAEVAE